MDSRIGKSNASRQTVLVVDDALDILRVVESILTEEGYEVIAADSADAAIEIFERQTRRPDIVLTDVVMPGMSGPVLVEHWQRIEPNLKVLFMSAYHDRHVVRQYVVDKGFHLISKPFTVNGL